MMMIGQEDLEMNLISTSNKLKIIKFISYYWDVIFTMVDNYQLKIWYILYKYRQELEEEANASANDFNDLENWSDWDDIQ